MIEKFRRMRDEFYKNERNRSSVFTATYAVLGAIGAVMTAINIFTHKGLLTLATGLFAALCAINILLSFLGQKGQRAAVALFSFEILVMFTFFLISGNPEGFSAIWICMLPSMGFYFFGRRRGLLLAAFMLAELVFFLWIPAGSGLLMYDYTASFRMRFPVLYASFSVLAYFLESLRMHAYHRVEEMELMYKTLSERDPLTGMFNRQGLYATLESEPDFADFSKLGVVLMDIDDFKRINDKYGHSVGDIVLKEFSAVIRDHLNCPVCRWGGEEFVAVYRTDAVTGADIERLRERIELHEFVSSENALHITSSVGVCELGDPKVRDIEYLIERADIALYNAKNSGKNRVVNYRKSLDPNENTGLAKTASHAELHEKLGDALAKKQFEPYMQYVYDVGKKTLTGAEVLSRWNHPEEGVLKPSQYLDDMRSTGMIDKLDFLMLEKACHFLETREKEGAGPLHISCNLTQFTISSEHFMDRFIKIVSGYTFDHANLTLEITEDTLVSNQAVAYQNVLKCREMGFRFALDDLGAGYSSINDLCDYPVDAIKIDRHIVSKSVSGQGGALLKGLVDLARKLNIQVICEGVETPEENNAAISSGCDFIQGYYYSRVYPMNDASPSKDAPAADPAGNKG